MLHGNAGQAADRAYALPSFSAQDSVLPLGGISGLRRAAGGSFDRIVRCGGGAGVRGAAGVSFPTRRWPWRRKSIGSGPACFLAGLPRPPDMLALIVPFDRLSLVARDHFPSLLVKLLMKGDWDNVEGAGQPTGARSTSTAPRTTPSVLSCPTPAPWPRPVPHAKFHLDGGRLAQREWSSPGGCGIRCGVGAARRRKSELGRRKCLGASDFRLSTSDFFPKIADF